MLTYSSMQDSWTQIIESVHEHTPETLKESLDTLALTIMDADICNIQKRAMRRFFRSPRDMNIHSYATHLLNISRMIQYLPSTLALFEHDELMEILVHSVDKWLYDLLVMGNFDYMRQSYMETMNKLSQLSMLANQIEKVKAKNDNGRKPKAHNASKYDRSRMVCNYCRQKYHLEEKCRKKKRDEAANNKKASTEKASSHQMTAEPTNTRSMKSRCSSSFWMSSVLR